MLIGYQDYAGNSFKNPNMAYIATKTSDKKMSETDKKILNNKPVVETPKSQRKQQVLGVQMNTSKEHFSSANTKTIPQPTKKQAKAKQLKY
ncbi:hypothetical protein CDQ80_05040 [Campylobacter hyointestinalis subsp. hyointestinalis]|nr:hypothetical protein CDQ79_01545 [Campylobacter hyointestinalis subsp. hyointestinalis]PPB75013.1 hypothetical protein CDQ80_05040 [Campylobacter hyointestinalis subsp. hyointestinalis]